MIVGSYTGQNLSSIDTQVSSVVLEFVPSQKLIQWANKSYHCLCTYSRLQMQGKYYQFQAILCGTASTVIEHHAEIGTACVIRLFFCMG